METKGVCYQFTSDVIARDTQVIPDWDKKFAQYLRQFGLNQEQIGALTGYLAEERQVGYMQGYNKGFNDGAEHQQKMEKRL